MVDGSGDSTLYTEPCTILTCGNNITGKIVLDLQGPPPDVQRVLMCKLKLPDDIYDCSAFGMVRTSNSIMCLGFYPDITISTIIEAIQECKNLHINAKVASFKPYLVKFVNEWVVLNVRQPLIGDR